MIPIFHASCDLAYAKCPRLNLQQMDALVNRLPEKEYQELKECFTIRRKNKFFNGNFSDQTIETDLMRLIKTEDGLTQGRGITDSRPTLAHWIHALPHCVPICDYVEKFTGIHISSSEQHKDLRPSSQYRDFKDWFSSNSPLSYTEKDGLVSLSTSEVAAHSVNCDKAYTIGKTAADSITGKEFPSIKLKHNDKIGSFNSSKNKMKVRDQDREISPTLLFHKITWILNTSTEMKLYLIF